MSKKSSSVLLTCDSCMFHLQKSCGETKADQSQRRRVRYRRMNMGFQANDCFGDATSAGTVVRFTSHGSKIGCLFFISHRVQFCAPQEKSYCNGFACQSKRRSYMTRC